MACALTAGAVVRAGSRDGGGAGLVAVGALALAAVVLLCLEVVAVLQGVQAREAVTEALRGLPEGFAVTGRVRVTGAGRRPVVVDHVVVAPGGTAFAVVVDGSTRPPAPGDALDGVAPLLPVAAAAAEALTAAAAAGVLPARVGLGARTRIRPCILVARRPIVPGPRRGVLTLAGADVLRVFGDAAAAAGPALRH